MCAAPFAGDPSWCLENKGQLGSGLGMVHVALRELSSLIGFLFCKVLVQSLRDENPSCVPYILKDSRLASSSPKLFLTAFLKILNVRLLLNDNKKYLML